MSQPSVTASAFLCGVLVFSLGRAHGKRDELQPPPPPPPIAPVLCSDAQVQYRQRLINAGRAVVQVAVADLWEKPQRRSSLADQAFLGEVVRPLPGQVAACGSIVGAGDYLHVSTESGYHAWAEIATLRPLPATDAAYRESGPLVRVAVRMANVYLQPTVTVEKPILVVPLDVPLRLAKRVDARWLQIVLPDGRDAFVQAGDITEQAGAAPTTGGGSARVTTGLPATPATDQAACVIEHARRYLGTPYLWGGRSTLGVDCSGLVLSSLNACGLLPPRDAGPQHDWPATAAVPQSVRALRTGDLLFFGKREPEASGSGASGGTAQTASAGAASTTGGLSGRIKHVGIYLGDGRFIHATTHQQPVVQESLITDPHWTSIWIGTRRPPYATR